MQDRPLPYNTGKVLIGSRYEPPRENLVVSEDALHLQAALLGDRRHRYTTADLALFICAFLAVSIIVGLLIAEAA